MRRRLAPVVLLVVLLAGACSGDDDGPAAPTPEPGSATTAATTTVPTFTGDPDSPFCELIRTADERPVLDPFEPELDPSEVELRFRALRNRFAEFAGVAPPELEPVLADLVAALDELGELLEANDHDFARVGESGADTDLFDDPAFADAATRIAAYGTQVCDA